MLWGWLNSQPLFKKGFMSTNTLLQKAIITEGEYGVDFSFNNMGKLNSQDISEEMIEFFESLISDIKAKVTAGDSLSDFLDNKIDVDYTLHKEIDGDVDTPQTLLLGMCAFAGLTEANVSDISWLIGETADGTKEKLDPSKLGGVNAKPWITIINQLLTNAYDADVDLTISALNATADPQYNINIQYYKTDVNECLGNIKSIDCTVGTLLQRTDMDGRLLCITADYNNWFNVLDKANTIPHLNGIATLEGDVYRLKKALFAYENYNHSEEGGYWNLISYEKVEEQFFDVNLSLANTATIAQIIPNNELLKCYLEKTPIGQNETPFPQKKAAGFPAAFF